MGSGSGGLSEIPCRPSFSPECFSKNIGSWFHKGECLNRKAMKLTLHLKIADLPSKDDDVADAL